MQLKLATVLGIVFLLMTDAQVPSSFESIGLPQNIKQIVLVTTGSWESHEGELRRFSRTKSGWEPVGDKIPVSLGRNGIAWGKGLQSEVSNAPLKREGDGKAVAGIFNFGAAFGYAPHPPDGVKLQYRQATSSDFYVDDVNSPQYNQWASWNSSSAAPWKSAERMRRDDLLYEFGIVVRQNESPVVPGKGSAVFFHVWRQPGAPTSGCTAMARNDLLVLMRWLDPGQNPLLIQVPESELNNLKVRKQAD